MKNLPVDKLQTLVFDLDGTLLNSKDDIADSLNMALEKLSLEPIKADIVFGYVGNGVSQLVLDTLNHIDKVYMYEDILSVFRQIYRSRLLNRSRLFPGVLEGLELLSKKYKLGMITNKSEQFTLPIVKQLNLERFFNKNVFAGDSLPVKKPDPTSLFLIMKNYTSSPDTTLMIGDSHVDIKTGKNAKAMTAAVTYGFANKDELIESKPDIIVDSFTQLVGFLSA